MSRLVTFLTTLWLSSAAAQFSNIAKGIQQGLTNEAQAVLNPIGQALTFIGSSQCANVQKIFGVHYDSYDDGEEPDLNKLTLMYITSAIKVSFNLSEAATTIPRSGLFNSSNLLYIYVHGFTDDPTKGSFTEISNAHKSQGDSNILALDASSLIKWFYIRSATYVRFIGEKLGNVLAALVNDGLDRNSIHMIGHSLGSHISGFAGKAFLEATGSRIGRISGLDPAGPCFSSLDVKLRLTKDDADFVDVIHTDAGVYGLNEIVGHVDFYPNSGAEQPNCLFQTCSHGRVWELYAESVVDPMAFIGAQCSSWEDFRKGSCDYNDTTIMGSGCPREARGKYYLQTAGEKPYGLKAQGIKYNNNAGVVRNIQNILTG